MQDLNEAIRERAYLLWIADGQPDGQADLYWLNAQREVLTTSLESSSNDTAVAAPRIRHRLPPSPPKRRELPDPEKAKSAPHNSTPASSHLTVTTAPS